MNKMNRINNKEIKSSNNNKEIKINNKINKTTNKV